MKTHRLHGLLAMLLFAGLAPASASIITYVPETPVDILPGGTVTFQIHGQSVNNIGGFSLYLNSDAASDDWIKISSASLNATLFTYGGPSPTFPEPISSTTISQDLGAFSNSALAANTSYLLTTVTITIDGSTPEGTYTVGNTTATVFANSTFTTSDFAAVAGFDIHVLAVPEPFTGALLTAGAGLMLAWRRRVRVIF
jgi:hypothetical protein